MLTDTISMGIARNGNQFGVFIQARNSRTRERLVIHASNWHNRESAEIALAFTKAEVCAILEGEDTMRRVFGLRDFLSAYLPDLRRGRTRNSESF